MIAIEKIFIFVLLFWKCLSQSYILEIDQGRLSGKARYDIKGGIFYSFQRIPYAKPPVGELRFKEPEPADKWDDILDATVDLPKCSQGLDLISTSEDCLYLNVYTPQFPSEDYDTLKDVMVWIHGGAFAGGSAREEEQGPEMLIPSDVVFVAINYRLGVFGSFHLEDTSLEYPGNLQMKDQALALKWVQSNIVRFGGNPDSVTIFGGSAGGASVHYHVLSPLSAGLFHNAIIESGTATVDWARGSSNNGILLAQMLNIPTYNSSEMIQRLQSVNREEIMMIPALSLLEVGISGSPIVEQDRNSETAFLTEDPLTIIKQGTYNHVPIMIGYADIDGALLGIHLSPEDITDQETYDFYVESGFFEHPLVQMVTDVVFGHPAYSAAKEHVKTANSPIYFYRFSADTAINIVKVNEPAISHLKGATHGDETGYFFNSTLRNAITVEPGSNEEKASERVVKLWTNFAKYGNPTPEEDSTDFLWMPITEETFYYAEIATYETTLDVNPDEKSMNFWDEFGNTQVTNKFYKRMQSLLRNL
uniref:Carboxylic ester hydrolase n=1 Tax=Holotrichia oblita TaxID=644536 RepID=E6Y8N0_HOLOL|nr:carboxylesterase [Holotrichia oblita]